VTDPDDFIDMARRAEEIGFDAFLIPDHLGALSPEIAMATVAQVTERIKVGSIVFNNDFRHPVILAQQAAAIDVFSGGRLELGLGAGWNEPEYVAMGTEIDPPSVRIARMEEAAIILKRLFGGKSLSFAGEHYDVVDHTIVPVPIQGADLPVHIGGNGDKLLAAAARTADVVGLTGFSAKDSQAHLTHFSTVGAANRIAHVRAHAGDRFDEIEFGALVQRLVVTDDRQAAAQAAVDEMREAGLPLVPTADELLDSPFAFFGTEDEIATQFVRHRDELGISYFTLLGAQMEAAAPIVAEVTGT
jgi:probable F420-dependent oxidoreductase